MVEDGLVLAMVMIMSEQEDFSRLCATVRETTRRRGKIPDAHYDSGDPTLAF